MTRTSPSRTRLIAMLLFALGIVSAGPAGSQEDMSQVTPTGFAAPVHGPVAFNHDEHNQKAKLDDCAACHHGGTPGRLAPGTSSEGQPCSDCHLEAGQGLKAETPLRRAWHRQCVGCHETKKAGPLACGECHPKSVALK